MTGEPFSLKVPRPLAFHQGAFNAARYLEAGQFWALVLMIVALPLSESLKNGAFGLALGCWVLRAVLGKTRRVRLTLVGAAQALLVAIALASALVALNPWQGFRGVWDVARAWLTFLLVLNTVTSWGRLKRCWALFVGATVIGCLVGLWEFMAGIPQAIEVRTLGGSYALEVLSLGHPNHTATYLLMMLVLAMAYLNCSGSLQERGYTLLFAGAAVVLVVSLFLTFSRSAGLAFLVVVIALGIAGGRYRLSAAVLAILLIGTIGATRLPVVSRYLTDSNHPFSTGAIEDRLHVWRGVLRLANERPLFGVGPRNFNYFDKRRYGISQSMDYFNHAHSLYFNVLAEMGWTGAGALFLWLGIVAKELWWSRRSHTTPWGTVVWMGALGCFLTVLVYGVMTTTLHTEGAMAFSAVLGLFLAVRELPTREPKAPGMIPVEAGPRAEKADG